MRNLKQLTDDRLSALSWDVEKGMRAIRASHCSEPLRIRRPMIAAVALVMALAAATALAVGLQVSRKVEVKRIAREAVMAQYGLDNKSVGMFSERAEEEGGVWTVTYSAWKPDEAGTYTVTVQKDGTAQVSWSLEGSADAWGQQEIAAYITQKDAAVHEMQLAEAAGAAPVIEAAPTPEPVSGALLTREKAIKVADEALRAQFGFQTAGLGEFDAVAKFDHMSGKWTVVYSAFGWHWHDGDLSQKAGEYHVELSDVNGQVLSARWTLEGVETGSFTRSTFGQAKAYDAQCMEWVAEIRAQFVQAYAAVEMSKWPVSVEEKARLDSLMIAAGFDAEKFNHVTPDKGDIGFAAALELAAQTLEREYGVSRAIFDASTFGYADLTQEKTHRQWYFWVQNHDIQMGWQMTIDAQTGEILDLSQESFAAGNG